MHSGQRHIAVLGALIAASAISGGSEMALSKGPDILEPKAMKPSAEKARRHSTPVPNKTQRGKRRAQTRRR